MTDVEKRTANTEKRIAAQKILADPHKNDDKKLFEVFEIYKDDLRQSNDQLYYALLGWCDAHLRDLVTLPVSDYFRTT